ncbi:MULTISPECIES: LPXTG cell wall anchor domain-containing protein [Cryobacterium]|uniref:LPXTG cell wall anchor domain-containing protein n=1 Tax=Cryobacterium breve TaxID=1259258 RepID=A0ABY2J9G9_9MICO|nr:MULTISPECIES: LPXTG cell wall anchor domain-containing protein [Cryobacterium]TFC92776.1 hypothetical protein E3T20_11545 [Cryobacterium sp. TmT3-12]TFD01604.1 hypothetical protein E3O65_01300 [Cryobacterium breve]
MAMVLGLLLAAFVLSASPVAPASAAPASPDVNQCNGTDNVGGQAVVCDITITNNYDLEANTASSIVTTTECHGSAGVPPDLTCVTLTETYPQLTLTATQCNGSGNDGGSNVICNVSIINNITGSFTATAATVNQCVESGTGGGTQPTVECDPLQNTNLATAAIVQCNGSGNGGGGADRVNCTIGSSTQTSVLPDIKVNQCVGSGTGGGATVDCSTRLTNNVVPAVVVAPPTAVEATSIPTETASPMVAPLVAAAPELAATGTDSAPLLISTAAGILLVAVGALLAMRRRLTASTRTE